MTDSVREHSVRIIGDATARAGAGLCRLRGCVIHDRLDRSLCTQTPRVREDAGEAALALHMRCCRYQGEERDVYHTLERTIVMHGCKMAQQNSFCSSCSTICNHGHTKLVRVWRLLQRPMEPRPHLLRGAARIQLFNTDWKCSCGDDTLQADCCWQPKLPAAKAVPVF